MKSGPSVWLLALLATSEGGAGRARIAEHIRRGEWQEALAAADAALADRASLELSEPELAELHFARGVVLLSRELEPEGDPEMPDGFQPAERAFQSARALSGPGALRLDATYDLGLVHFHEGERAREQIPEVSGAALQPDTAPGEDPLAQARGAYSNAKDVFLERLRADWRDEDTRANLELLQKRLKELDEIERQRKEEEERDEQQQESEQDSQDEPSEPQSDATGKEEPPEDQSPENQPGKDQPPGEDQPQSEQQPQSEEQEPGDSTSAEDAERHLTREQVLQLLDKLGELEREAQALEAQIREARRVPVARDW